VNAPDAKIELKLRLLGEEVFGYFVEEFVAATGQEALQLKLPDNGDQLLG
jgi:hypothetical protein